MQSAAEYLDRTESAVQRLFEGIDAYLSVLRKATGVTFITSVPHGPAQDAAFAAWQAANVEQLAAARTAERNFMAEAFALDTLCGAVLQVAGKALEMYGQNTIVPQDLSSFIKAKYAKFCVGRSVRTVPLGLVIYAARNQHTHFDDKDLREPSASIFNLLATAHGYGGNELVVESAFDMDNPRLLSLASNVTSLMGWRSYANYAKDMRALLET